jgi:hypothetical protein
VVSTRRLAVVVVLLSCGFAGCLGGPSAPATGTTSPAPTADGPTTDRPAATAYPDRTATFPPGPKDRPEPPASFTAERAAAYAVAFEYRYSYNRLSPGPVGSVGLSEASCRVDSTESAGDGYLVVVTCRGYVNEPGAGTATEHVDLAPWTVRYYLDPDSVLREKR